jgi:hypothetical protein
LGIYAGLNEWWRINIQPLLLHASTATFIQNCVASLSLKGSASLYLTLHLIRNIYSFQQVVSQKAQAKQSMTWLGATNLPVHKDPGVGLTFHCKLTSLLLF